MRLAFLVLMVVILAGLVDITLAQNSGRTSGSRTVSSNSYGSVRHSNLYTTQKSRDADFFIAPSGERVYTRLPRGAKRITVNRRTYYNKDNVYYYRHFFEGKYVYTIGPPPIGLKVTKLPGPYTFYTYQGKDYYVSNGTYYVKELRGYAVVQQPR